MSELDDLRARVRVQAEQIAALQEALKSAETLIHGPSTSFLSARNYERWITASRRWAAHGSRLIAEPPADEETP